MVSIIQSVEINYFRSIYRTRLSGLSDVNVISGKNDVGKSNILKALNLFFNNQSDWQKELNFQADFSKERLTRVRQDTVKGKQFISVELVINRPDTFSGSLPKTIKVKRTWLRNSQNYSETTNLEGLKKQGKLPRSLAIAKQFLPILLNRIHYEYVPAVKDRNYYEHLLLRLQKTLLDIRTDSDSEISEMAKRLAAFIQIKIVDLSRDFERATQIQSLVAPPTEFADLFQAFVVSTLSGVENIPLVQRGDGIQARYVSSVLEYISSKSSGFFIWGFEEPENSLEYSRAIDLANDLVTIYSREAQIFLTTHSPAFTSLQTKYNTCYRAYKDERGTTAINIWPENDNYLEREKLVYELGVMRLQEKLHQEYLQQSKFLKIAEERKNDLELELQKSQKPLVLVSGKTDKTILETAWSKCFPSKGCPFIIRSVDTSNSETDTIGGDWQLRITIESIHPDSGQKAIAIFDRDSSGVAEFDKLTKNFSATDSTKSSKAHRNKFAFAILLPIPDFRIDYIKYGNLCIEFLFPEEALEKKTESGDGLKFKKAEVLKIVVSGNRQLPSDEISPISLPEGLRTIEGGKIVFAEEIVPDLSVEHFDQFAPLFAQISKLLGIKM